MLINNKGSTVTCAKRECGKGVVQGGLGRRSLPVTVGHTHRCGQPAGGAESS